MPYSATTYRLLLSPPGDIPNADFRAVIDAVTRWNALYGRQFGVVVVPTHWQLHSAAEHGDRPQASLNAQLVEDADILVALFWSRLGSPTGEAESGTVEEIETAHGGGAYVAILRCARNFPQAADLEQLRKLQAFYAEVEPRSLVLSYSDEAELFRHVDTILTRATTRYSTRAEVAAAASRADVWPRVESNERVRTNSKGRLKTSRRWQLVLANTGTEPARNVRYHLEPENEGDQLPVSLDDDNQQLESVEAVEVV